MYRNGKISNKILNQQPVVFFYNNG